MSSSAESAGRWFPSPLPDSPKPDGGSPTRETASPWRPSTFDGSDPAATAATPPDRSDPEPWTVPSLGSIERNTIESDDANDNPDDPEPSGTYREGYEAGFREGENLAAARTQPAADALREVASALAASQGDILRNLEANVAALALGVARKIVQREVSATPEILQNLVAKALDLVKPGSPIEVRLNPEDLDIVREELTRTPLDDQLDLRWTPDPDIDRGGFFVEGPERIIDGRLEESLRNLYERLIYE